MSPSAPRRRASFRSRLRAALPALAAGVLLACAEEDASGVPAPAVPVDCAALSDSLFPESKRTGVAQFKVVDPDTGGTFRVGQELRVVVAGADFTSALVDLVVYGPQGGVARVPGFPNRAVDVRKDCEFRFAVPESVTTTQGRRIPLAADSVKARVADYTDGDSFDYSDRPFFVAP